MRPVAGALIVVKMEGPASGLEFGNAGHEIVGLKDHLLLAILAIAAPDEAVGVFEEAHRDLLSPANASM
jgi:hypothetical protein